MSSAAQLDLGELRPNDPTPKQLKFWLFHKAHPEVFNALLDLAHAKVARQRRMGVKPRIGIKALWERLRWDYDDVPVGPRGRGPKLNNDLTAAYARLLMEEPGLAGVFQTREREP